MLTPVIVAVPGKRYRLTPVTSLGGTRHFRVETWEPQSHFWYEVAHVGIPHNFTEQMIDQAVELAVSRFCDKAS